MAETKLTMNVLLSLIIQCKKSGKGMVGNGRLLIKLLQIIADTCGEEKTPERNVIAYFYSDANKVESYRKIDKLIGRFLPQGRYYPYDKLRFTEFEKLMSNPDRMKIFLHKASDFVDEIFDKEKLDSFVYTLLETIRQDSNIVTILYNTDFISKKKLCGSYAHPKRICVEALLVGALYYVHKNPAEEREVQLHQLPEKLNFRAVRYKTVDSLKLDLPINVIDNICEIAVRQKTVELKYSVEIKEENSNENNRNIFLYGSGGIGKTTYLKSLVSDQSYVNFIFLFMNIKMKNRGLFIQYCLNIIINTSMSITKPAVLLRAKRTFYPSLTVLKTSLKQFL